MTEIAYELGSNPTQDWIVSQKELKYKRWKHLQIAFPENVYNNQVKIWSEWRINAQYTKNLLAMAQGESQYEEIDCSCCLPNNDLPFSNPLKKFQHHAHESN